MKSGDQAAFAEIYDRYWSVRNLLLDNEEARDIMQELFTTLWQTLNAIETSTNLSSYLYNVVRNRIFDHLKHKKMDSHYV